MGLQVQILCLSCINSFIVFHNFLGDRVPILNECPWLAAHRLRALTKKLP